MKYGATPGMAWASMQRIYIGSNNVYTWIDPLAPRTIYVKVASYDVFRKGDLEKSVELTVTTT